MVLPDCGQFRQIICDVVQRECARCFSGLLRALISTGSMARDEATIISTGDSWTVRGDAEFLLIFEQHAFVPTAEAIGAVQQKIQSDLLQRRIQCKIDLRPVDTTYFKRLPAHIFSYELKHRARIIEGDEAILRSIPDYSADELSKEDAWQLLCNRLIEVLEFSDERFGENELASPELQYRLVKLVLDMATSLLVFSGGYVPSYRERCEAILQLASQQRSAETFPFELEVFTHLVATCTAEKLQPPGHVNRLLDLSQHTVMQIARALWRWELIQLVGTTSVDNERDLFEHWIRLQPSRKIVRGWLYVVRACGWLRSYRLWPRWWNLRKASPRHWIYLISSSLLFDATDGMGFSQVGRSGTDLASLSRCLPVAKITANQQLSPSWKDVACDAVWNYREFLTGTRT